MNLSERMTYLVEILELNLLELGRQIGIKTTFLYDVKNGNSKNPNLIDMHKFLKGVGLTVEEFLTDDIEQFELACHELAKKRLNDRIEGAKWQK